MQDENKEGGKTSQLPVSGIGKGLTLGNVLKFGFRVFPLFVLIQKVEQKNQVPANAPPPGRPAHLWQV